jgi:hypothetical protein
MTTPFGRRTRVPRIEPGIVSTQLSRACDPVFARQKSCGWRPDQHSGRDHPHCGEMQGSGRNGEDVPHLVVGEHLRT